MADLRKDKKFHKTLEKLVKRFHEELHKEGFKLTISKLSFNAQKDNLVCTDAKQQESEFDNNRNIATIDEQLDTLADIIVVLLLKKNYDNENQ